MSETNSPLHARGIPGRRCGILAEATMSRWRGLVLRRRTLLSGAWAIASVPLMAACGSAPDAPMAEVRMVEPPTDPTSGMYCLSRGAAGTALLSWIVPGERAALRYARWDGEGWSEARTIAEGEHWFVNWVDRPVVSESGGTLLAHYLQRPEAAREAKYGYGLRALTSIDGEDWSEAFELGMANVSDYTGFVGYEPIDGGFLMAYLDPAVEGPEQGGAYDAHLKTLRLAEVGTDGVLRADVELDGDVCTCCPLGVAQTSAGPAVVYRDHREGEIRDISIVRRVGGEWTEPATVFADGWEIHGCPANGPSIAADGEHVAVAWFTAAQDTPRVRLALSQDAGATFGAAIEIDEGDPLGWADVAWVNGRVAVSWLENDPATTGRGTARVRFVDGRGEPRDSLVVAEAPGGRGAGVPQMAAVGSDLLLAWRDADQVRAALVTMAD